MKKRTKNLSIVVLLLLSSAMLFAQGTKDTASDTSMKTEKSDYCICEDPITLTAHIHYGDVFVMDNDKYPIRVMHRLLNGILNDYTHDFPEIWKNSSIDYSIDWDKFYKKIVKYQDPREADKLYSIRCNLDETKEIMYQNIENILARGEQIDDLVQRSSDLSKTSKQFYKTTKKMNRCCIIT